MDENYTDRRQIIDEAWRTEDIVSLFANWGFVPCAMQMYGIDVVAQYAEYVFMKQDALERVYKDRMETLLQKE
jgi:hypothetical protein